MHWLYAHFIGDYLLQNDWMALNKKKEDFPCLVHVILYLLPFLFCKMKWWILLAIGLHHYAQDRSNFIVWLMKIKGSKQFSEAPCAPWSIFLTDNIIHILWIAFLMRKKKRNEYISC